MNRPLRIWLVFGLCLAVALGGLGWITHTTLQLDRAQAAAEQQALVEENTRLALWRMDSAVLPILMEENARPYFQYSAYYHPAGEVVAVPQEVVPGSKANEPGALAESPWVLPGERLLTASPLAEQAAPFVKLYFQIDPQGDFISPQVNDPLTAVPAAGSAPTAAGVPAVAPGIASVANIWVDNLIELQKEVAVDKVRQQLATAPQPADAGATANSTPPGAAPMPDPVAAQESAWSQSSRNTQEYKVRQQALSRAVTANSYMNDQAGQSQAVLIPPNGTGNSPADPATQRAAAQRANPAGPATVAPPSTVPPQAAGDGGGGARGEAPSIAVPAQSLENIYQTRCWFQPVNGSSAAEVGMMQPTWEKEKLLITRRVQVSGQSFVQGAWFDWPALRQKLLRDAVDLLPNATLEPLPKPSAGAAGANGAADASEHRLALLPVRLVPGLVPGPVRVGLSPVQQTLLIAWLAILLAAGAVAVLLRAVMGLSERRAAFVSAVTHELRTPLTTFRMYTEMLEAGMVTDPAKRAKYLETMKAEAVRLGHLVENVLAYARLERTGASGGAAERARLVSQPVAGLLARMQERLSERAAQAGMTLAVELEGADAGTAGPLAVRADPAAVEQILFNLVDNACKYGQPAAGGAGRIVIRAVAREQRVVFEVRDSGAGVAADQQPRLFEPFSRSAEAAANSATRTPGVGLGLALSRRLARAMGGDLTWVAAIKDGACFELTLPMR